MQTTLVSPIQLFTPVETLDPDFDVALDVIHELAPRALPKPAFLECLVEEWEAV